MLSVFALLGGLVEREYSCFVHLKIYLEVY